MKTIKLITEPDEEGSKQKKIATLVLMTAMFLNPLGYDALFYMVLKATGNSYAITTGIFLPTITIIIWGLLLFA